VTRRTEKKVKNYEESQKIANDFDNALELCKLEFEAKKQHELKNIIQEKERLNELIKTSVVHYPELWYSQQEDLELFAIAQNT